MILSGLNLNDWTSPKLLHQLVITERNVKKKTWTYPHLVCNQESGISPCIISRLSSYVDPDPLTKDGKESVTCSSRVWAATSARKNSDGWMTVESVRMDIGLSDGNQAQANQEWNGEYKDNGKLTKLGIVSLFFLLFPTAGQRSDNPRGFTIQTGTITAESPFSAENNTLFLSWKYLGFRMCYQWKKSVTKWQKSSIYFGTFSNKL